MGKVQLFEIRLGDSRVVYSPGEPLTGTVTVRLAGSLQYRAIKVICVGSCGVSSKINDTAWTVEEQYFNSTLSLADKGFLTAGEHTFPFQFLLPASAPTSFEGPFGKVTHQIKAVIETPRFSKSHKCSKVFYVLCPLNLNEIPEIEQLNTASVTKKFNYKLVKSGNVIVTATTDLKGYVVGQVIHLRTDIENKSGRDTGTIVASLIQKVAYKSKRWIYDLRTIAEVEGSAVKAWKHAEWKEQILVPALPQSILQGCSLIHIDYYIQVSLKSPDVSVTLPIYIGNIAVNRIPLSPSRSAPHIVSSVVPTAPPEDEEAASGCHRMDNVSIPTKSHSQQQPFSYAPGLNFQEARLDSEQTGSPNHPTLCLSTGATVPYYSEGTVVPVPTANSLILPPEYSTWGYPYGCSEGSRNVCCCPHTCRQHCCHQNTCNSTPTGSPQSLASVCECAIRRQGCRISPLYEEGPRSNLWHLHIKA
ncbi:arrestin domain-containing protein 1 isoform X2 [Sphaerodactylus townsendi]|uniref:arrestin domain-containing protein 1 isoform X2 n=1 Tax=Sphaerodactylus townsendi TaxID=933632 RepID=UPI002026F30F|nr:arrestin domain-containing protein 1 isoform X2 [Sphaerodactylus townsendi]